jgi:hypothetical protein
MTKCFQFQYKKTDHSLYYLLMNYVEKTIRKQRIYTIVTYTHGHGVRVRDFILSYFDQLFLLLLLPKSLSLLFLINLYFNILQMWHLQPPRQRGVLKNCIVQTLRTIR